MIEPEDPIRTVPLASNVVTIGYDESGMDTENSIVKAEHFYSQGGLINKSKRTSASKICKHCNKKQKLPSRHQFPVPRKYQLMKQMSVDFLVQLLTMLLI